VRIYWNEEGIITEIEAKPVLVFGDLSTTESGETGSL
jgi:hypothetical protein